MIGNIRTQLKHAIATAGFENWSSPIDVPHLKRPPRRPTNMPGTGNLAAVLMLIHFNGKGESILDGRIVLTKRQSNLSKHAGQVSFPGGRIEPNETRQQTAIREAQEEIGIHPDAIEVMGRLNSVYIPPSDFTMTPFVAWQFERPNLEINDAEVAELIEVPINHILDPASLQHRDIATLDHSGQPRQLTNVPAYVFAGHVIWGATAIVLTEWICRLNKINRE